MKIALVYPRRRHWPKWDWVLRAVQRAGHVAKRVRSVEALECADAECDIVLFCQRGCGVGKHNVRGKLAESRKAFWVEWVFDLVAMEDRPLAEQGQFCNSDGSPTVWLQELRKLDLVLVKERSLLDEYRALGVNATWFDQACPQDMPACEHKERPRWDIVLWGCSDRRWLQRRHDVQALVDAGFRIAWASLPSSCVVPRGVEGLPFCDPMELPGLASQAAIVLDVPARDDVLGYYSDKLWMVLGMGACHLRRWSPGLPTRHKCFASAVNETWCEFETYNCNSNDLVPQVKRLLTAGVDTRRSIGQCARDMAMHGNTYEDRVRKLVRLCKFRIRASAASAAVSAG